MLLLVGEESATLESLQFGLVTIEAATNKFSYEKRIGEGGFGVVEHCKNVRRERGEQKKKKNYGIW